VSRSLWPTFGCWTSKGFERKVSGIQKESIALRTFNFVVERDPQTSLLVGYVPGWPGAHTQGADLDELQRNLREVIEMLLEDGEPVLESEFVDVRTIQVA
jgi:predicted RNase H-like HicB family nuclease